MVISVHGYFGTRLPYCMTLRSGCIHATYVIYINLDVDSNIFEDAGSQKSHKFITTMVDLEFQGQTVF